MNFLLDTNVISEIRRPERAHPSVLAWASAHDPKALFISVMTVFEIEIGIHALARRDKIQSEGLRRWKDANLLPSFAGRILPVDEIVASACAPLHVPNRRPLADSLIAAIALIHDLVIITRNIRDFEPTGVRLFNPWDYAP